MRVFAIGAGCLLMTVRAAAAEPSCGSERPWVALSVEGETFSGAFVTTLLGDLRAGLRDQGIDVCPAELGAGKPVARVMLRASEVAPLGVGIDVVDAVTNKRVVRDVDLAKVPEDGRPFALAVATDELLRASWVELALEKREPSPAPPEVKKAALEALPPAPVPERDRISPPPARATAEGVAPTAGLRLATEHYSAGQTHFGVDVTLRLPLSRRLGVELAFGARKALGVEADSGAVSASALGGEASAWLGLAAVSPVTLDAFAGVRALRISFDASADPGATERDTARWALTARGGLALRVGGKLRAGLRAGLGAPLVGVEISEGQRVISGVAGLELFAGTGLEVEF